ncbi:MAG TPA: hypothetical protein VI365_29980 [Trebonia sp.]
MSRRSAKHAVTISVALAAVTLTACSGTAATQGMATQPAREDGQGAVLCGGSPEVPVSTASGLRAALEAARPGETISLAPGTYNGDFEAAASGTMSAPITLCGPRSAVLEGESITSGYTLYLDHASYWRVAGFTVEGGQKGIVTDSADYDVLSGLSVSGTGDEAIHLRDFSSHDTVSHNVIRDTGLHVAFYGEGIYVGSAHKNWCQYSGCQPDASDDDILAGNDIANTTAENIDIKEGTTGGTITGNHLNGTGMVSSAATSWINVKGNDWTITGNTGTDSIGNGFSVHQVYPGWGLGNVFQANVITVNGPGYGIFVQNKRLKTVVYCGNKVTGAQSGFSNIACTPG